MSQLLYTAIHRDHNYLKKSKIQIKKRCGLFCLAPFFFGRHACGIYDAAICAAPPGRGFPLAMKGINGQNPNAARRRQLRNAGIFSPHSPNKF
jgi:hypothetical protein